MDSMLADHLLLLVQGSTHGNAKGLGLITSRDYAAIVVGKHYHGHTGERRVKDPLAGAEEVVAVDQGQAAFLLL